MHPLQWKREQTGAVVVLKEKLMHLPPLSVPFDGKRILQVDDSEMFWTVILLEGVKERDASVNKRVDDFHLLNFTTTLHSKKL